MTQTIRPQMMVNHRTKSVVKKSYDFKGEKIHISMDPAPGDPIPYFECDRCKHSMSASGFSHVGVSDKLGNAINRKYRHAIAFHPFCNRCRAQLRGEWIGHKDYSIELDRWCTDLSGHASGGAKKRGILYGIDKDDVLGMFFDQNGICALSGLEMDWKTKGYATRNGKNYKAPSIDRIDSGGNYVIGNIHLVMSIVNIMKNDLPVDMFIAMCRQISEKSTLTFC